MTNDYVEIRVHKVINGKEYTSERWIPLVDITQGKLQPGHKLEYAYEQCLAKIEAMRIHLINEEIRLANLK